MRNLALAVVGLGAADPDPYLELVAGPGESDAMRSAMLTMSGCGLTVRGLWRRFGMKDARLVAPYQPGAVITDLIAMAQEANGWTPGMGEIAVGDMIYVSAPDHVGTVVQVEPKDDGSIQLTTVDGGSQDGAGNQKIVTWDRAIAASGALTAGPLAGNGRTLLGVASLPALAATFGGSDVASSHALAELVGVTALGGAAWLAWKHRRRLGL